MLQQSKYKIIKAVRKAKGVESDWFNRHSKKIRAMKDRNFTITKLLFPHKKGATQRGMSSVLWPEEPNLQNPISNIYINGEGCLDIQLCNTRETLSKISLPDIHN